MSVNYYAFGPGIADPEGLHIGQAAAGWRFLFRAHPDRQLTTAAAWDAFLHQNGIRIEAEHGLTYTADEMLEIAVQRLTDNEDQPLRPRFSAARTNLPTGYTIDPDGYHVFYDGEFC